VLAFMLGATPSNDGFPTPPVLRNESKVPGTTEVTITAAPARMSLVAGSTTDVFAFNGVVPGPTLEVTEGDHLIVHFHNALSVPTTIHWHGLHIPAVMDGSPLNLVKAGASYDYVFDVRPGTAGTYWYHPHPDAQTGYQIAKGLVGAMIVRAKHDPVPASVRDRLLVLTDNRLLADGSLDIPRHQSVQGMIDEVNGREGNVLFVNGSVMPTISIRPGEVQRWRVVNASAARVYRLAIPGQTMLHIGNDGGLFEKPVEVSSIVVANSERVELLIRGTGAAGNTTTLQTLPYDRYVPQTRPADWNVPKDLLTLRYTNDAPVEPVALPTTYRVVPVLDTTTATAVRIMALSQGLINGRAMNMMRVDVRAKVGATEIWQVENLVGMDHPFHLHGFQFQVLERDGVAEPFRSWKDVVNVRKHETVRFIVQYADFPGRWMFHCHILDHEDHGMMGILEIH
jgi:bilirubin oxidase